MEALNRNRVKGFLDTQGRKIVNEDGDEVLLYGFGVGNWMLQEGYMWRGRGKKFDRPRRIEATIKRLCGEDYAKEFWVKFHENYFCESDIELMAEMGCNSVRLPFNWRMLMEEKPGVHFIEYGFLLLERVIDWCEKHKIYVWLDLHGAPGGQTGSNIDDSENDYPEMYENEDYYIKTICLWQELAKRYNDRWIVAGYDLLNEPIRTHNWSDTTEDIDYLVPLLCKFYEDAVAAIREIDTTHLISIEGHHWSSMPDIFYKKYDDRMVLHFHRYWCTPDYNIITEFIERGKALDVPLWLGETGENVLYWYTALYPLAFKEGIGLNFWTWKKIGGKPSPLHVKEPADWDKFIGFANGENILDSKEGQTILNEYLENIKAENCVKRFDVPAAILRHPPCAVRATDFDEPSAKVPSFNLFRYRENTGMTIIPKENYVFGEKRWDVFILQLNENECVNYSFYNIYNTVLNIKAEFDDNAALQIYQNDVLLNEIKAQLPIKLHTAEECVIKLKAVSGTVFIDELEISQEEV